MPNLPADLARRLGRHLTAVRQERRLIQELVADAAGISRNHLQLLELGLNNLCIGCVEEPLGRRLQRGTSPIRR